MGIKTMTAGALDMTCLAAATVAAEVRQRIDFRLASWAMSGLAHDAHLIAAELIANACAATPEGSIRVRFSREARGVVMAVWDASDEGPKLQPLKELELEDLDLSPENFDDNGGWGLHMVRAVAAETGIRLTEPHGKWVWARLVIS